MEGLTQVLPEALPALGFGSLAGLVVGYAAKKLTKLAALLLGGLFILIQLLAYFGFIIVNWGNVQMTAAHMWHSPDGTTLLDRSWQILVANLPFAGSFAGGFALGFKLG